MKRQNKVSIRQPLVLYATVFMILIAFVVLSVASISMVHGARRAYRRAAKQQLRALIADRTLAEARAALADRVGPEISVSVATGTVTAFGLDVAALGPVASGAEERADVVAVAILEPGVEAYAVARLTSTIPTSIAFVEISRLVPLVLLGALLCAGVLAFFIGRLLLPPLDALAEMAEDPRPVDSSDGLEHTGAPTEIHEVARRFRQTVRLLNEERDLVQSQRDELERMQESLVRASKLASVGRLAAGLAHEIGNPLAAVKGYLQIMKGGLEEPQRSKVLDRSVKELDRIHHTIQKLLTYARHGEGHREALQEFSAKDAVQETLTLVAGHPDLRGVQIDADLPEDLPKVTGHPGRLNQVLLNLLLNAAQAMANEAAPKVALRAYVELETVVIEVRDNGPGISSENLEAIFDPFFTTKEPGQGTGLGLAVSRALMEAMGGDLTLQRADEPGATFHVFVPTVASDLPD